MIYLSLKLIHILSAIVLFGLGSGTVFYKVMTDKSGNHAAIAVTSKHVVLADCWFTTPTVIIQPLTGFLLAQQSSSPFSNGWLWWTLLLYAITGLCWLPVLVLQIRMRDLAAESLAAGQALPSIYSHYARIWLMLGVPAFFGMIGITTLMVFHNSLWS
ncbi:MAG: DUF2269 domain-containing protein [Methylococcales bacterium]|nr:DUF2269 domain-containing protein [Methylococcales bacterium]